VAREISLDGIVWNCTQAYAGVDPQSAAAQVAASTDGTLTVVCTPSGGEQTVRLELPQNWENMPDDALARAIQQRRS
jgi:hypothetical protein